MAPPGAFPTVAMFGASFTTKVAVIRSPAVASRAKRTVAIRTLATLLGVRPDELRTVAAESGLAARWQIAWDDVERLDLKAIARLRAAEHRRKVSLRTSHNWVAGYPRLLREWDVDRNIGVNPWQVSRGSSRRFWWRCPEGPDHVWRMLRQQAALNPEIKDALRRLAHKDLSPEKRATLRSWLLGTGRRRRRRVRKASAVDSSSG